MLGKTNGDKESRGSKCQNVANTAKRKISPKIVDESRFKDNRKKQKLEKMKPPTLEEINELRETRNLFHSNLFRLQVKEMLEQVDVKEKYKTFLNSWLERFQKFLEGLDSMEVKEESSAITWLSETPLQLPLSLEELRIEKRTFLFQFIKPTTPPFFIGAAATETFLGPKLVADMCLVMPEACFQKDDYLNMVYDQKRALYLVYIAKHILENNFDGIGLSHVHFNYYANNPLKPVLVITPADIINKKQKLSIRVFIATEESTFKLSRFVPWNNNIRSKIFRNVADDDIEQNAATPHYNANILFDLTLQTNLRIMSTIFKGNKNVQEALVVLKVWLRQRQLHIGYTGFSAYIIAMFVCYLQRQRKLHQNMSSYQVTRTIWNHLAHSNWDTPTKGISLYDEREKTTASRPTLAQFHEHYEVVFVDVTGFFNICANLSLEIYKRVRLEAKLAVEMLNDMNMNSFQTLFMTKLPLYAQVDQILKISKFDAVEQLLEMHVQLSVKEDFVCHCFPQLLKVVTRLLQKGLGQRIQAIIPIEQDAIGWSCSSAPNATFGRHLLLGLILNPKHAFEVLDKGPESIDSDAEEFRRFWGDRAKLRRFQDGTITESVVWASNSDTLAKKRQISREIVLHLLQNHFQLEQKDVIYIGGELDVVYKLTAAFKTEHMHEKFKVAQDTDSEFLCLRVIHIFDDLARKLHALKELPLEIISIVGISPVFRYAEPTPLLPQARMIAENMYANSVQHGIIQLASSGKWPSELPALHAMKTAFYIQIAQLLRKKYKLSVKVTFSGVLIIKQGYCFNIEIAHPKELALLKQSKTERGITHYIDSSASIELEKRHYVIPKVTGALHALHHQHSSFGGVVMITKRWLYAQLIDPGLWPDECTELLIALLYLRTVNTDQITCTPQPGFIRFLYLIAYSDWKSELFLLNFNNSMNESEISELELRYNEKRSQFPPLCIATAYDRGHYGKLWTSEQRPSVNIIARVALLARQALEMIESSVLNPEESFIRSSRLFVPSTEGYDLVIQLKPEEVPNTTGFDFGSPFSVFTKPNWRLPLAGTDFYAMAVSKLREAYGGFAAFFFNPCGGKIIGVIWKPDIFVSKEFKLNEVQGCHPTQNQQLECCRETLIEDFKFILKDFYLRIDSVEYVVTTSKEAAQNIMTDTPRDFDTKQRYFNSTQTNKQILQNSTKVTKVKKNKCNFVKNSKTKSKEVILKTKNVKKTVKTQPSK